MIPDYQTLMFPVLKAGSGGEAFTPDVITDLAAQYKLTPEEQSKLLPSGKQTTISNRVHWAKSYLKQAGLLKYTRRNYFTITELVREVLGRNLSRIDNNVLEEFEGHRNFISRKRSPDKNQGKQERFDVDEQDTTPDEALRAAHKTINGALAIDLLDRVRSATPLFFEQLLIELLIAMGYGGASNDAGRTLGRSGDDGVIDQDPLGVDQIYVQAKRYAEGNDIGPANIRDFFGALNLKKAHKGIFFTTSAFSLAAEQTAKDLGMRIVLIDGLHLANLMIRYNVGCRDEDVPHLKKIDEEFFE